MSDEEEGGGSGSRGQHVDHDSSGDLGNASSSGGEYSDVVSSSSPEDNSEESDGSGKKSSSKENVEVESDTENEVFYAGYMSPRRQAANR
jgi:hypothetical protein